MALSAGIVGLPNVGKSSLFQTITNISVLIENYPFATIEPNVGIVSYIDPRIEILAKMIQPEKVTYANFKFVDIAGLVKGASKGEGLGNKFLQNIRDVDAICHVVRCFEDKNVLNNSNVIDPVVDAQIIDLELVYADLEVIKNALNRLPKKMGNKPLHPTIDVWDLLEKVRLNLQNEIPLRLLDFSFEELIYLKSYNFLTIKPMLYIANVNDSEINNPESNIYFNKIAEYAKKMKSFAIALSIKLENEISLLEKNDQIEILKELNITETGLNKIIKSTFLLLNLESYFTYGKIEVRAWPFLKGSKAPQCAGLIHSDFERGFIQVEVMKFADLVKYGSEINVKAAGKMNFEGKNYIIQDGDICHFKFNV